MNNRSATRKAIVVGVDGSAGSDLALDWAVEEATRRGLPLRIIHSFFYGYPMTSIGLGYPVADLSDLAIDVGATAVERSRRTNPNLDVTWEQPAYGRPAAALVSASETADTLVVGARGMSAVRGVLMGSVSVQVAAHAHCPVVVVHELPTSAPAAAPVVVGVDGSDSSTDAIAFAYEQASSRGVGLTVVHAWSLWWPDYVEVSLASAIWAVDWRAVAQEEEAVVAESLAGWQEKYPDVTVRRQMVRQLPVEDLVDESRKACLVVGSRGCGGFAGLLLGSVSQGVMHRTHYPVAIVHTP